MKCNYPGAYKRNKLSAKERRDLEAKLREGLLRRLFRGFPLSPYFDSCRR